MKKSEQNIPLPLPENENERLNALVEYNILDTISQEQFDRLTKLASIICETPIALISLIDKDRQWFKSSIGLDIKETSREVSFCQYTIIGNQQFEVFDAKNDIRFAQNPLVTGKPDIRFYAGYPLIDPKGYALGTLCVIDTVPKVLTLNQSLALKTLAEDIMLQIESVKKNEDKRKFEKLFSISIDLISILGTDGFFKKINPAFSNLFGWTNEELLKKQYWDFFHPDDVEKTKVEFEKMSGGIKTSTCLNRFLDSKGNFIWIQWKFNLDEETKDFYAIGRDISKEMVNDKVLKDAKIEADRLRNVQEEKSKQLNEAQRIAHVGSWQWDIETGKEVWSDEQFRIFGFEPGESEATYELFSKCLHSEDHDKVMQDVAKAIEEKKDFNSEYRIVTKNGAIRNIEARAETIVNPEGKVVKMRGTVRDVTEKKIAEDKIKESQDRFFRIFEKNPVAMSLSNLETSKLEFVNDVFLNSLNYNRDEIIGKTSEELNIMTPEEREKFKAEWKNRCASWKMRGGENVGAGTE